MHKAGAKCTAVQCWPFKYRFLMQSLPPSGKRSVSLCFCAQQWMEHCPIKFAELDKGNGHFLHDVVSAHCSSSTHLYFLSIRDYAKHPYFFSLCLCIEFAWEGFGSWGRAYRGGFCQKMLGAYPISNRASAKQLQDRHTAGQI